MGAVRAVGADCTLGPLGPSDGLILLAQQAYKNYCDLTFEQFLPFLSFSLGKHSSESTFLHSCIVLPLPLKREDRLRCI